MENRTLQTALMEAMHRFKRIDLLAAFDNLTRGEFFILEVLRQHWYEHPETDGMYVSGLAECLHISAPSVSRTLRSLEAKGYIERNVDKEDRRNTYIRLTESGEGACRSARERMHNLGDRIVREMGEEDMRTLLRLFNRLIDVLKRELSQDIEITKCQNEGDPND